MANIGFIGLGNMGGPMAINLVKAGHNVTGYDLSQPAVDAFQAEGGNIATTLAGAVRGMEVVITMLPAGAHVRSVYKEAGVFANAEKGALIIDSSTIDVATTREIASMASVEGLNMVDAPVSGGVTGAAAGTLTFMVGGTQSAFERAKPFLEVMGKTIVHAGGAGNGQAAKICNNMILGISMIGVCEAFNLADALGLNHQILFDISSTASGQCWSLTTYCPVPGPVPTSPANQEYQPGFSAAMMVKDLLLSQEAAQSERVTTPLGAQSAQLYNLFCAAGGQDVDFSGIINFLSGSSPKN